MGSLERTEPTNRVCQALVKLVPLGTNLSMTECHMMSNKPQYIEIASRNMNSLVFRKQPR